MKYGPGRYKVTVVVYQDFEEEVEREEIVGCVKDELDECGYEVFGTAVVGIERVGV